MIESWILEKLDAWGQVPMVILRDPLRMIRAGARTVCGWIEENETRVPRKDPRDAGEGMTNCEHGISWRGLAQAANEESSPMMGNDSSCRIRKRPCTIFSNEARFA